MIVCTVYEPSRPAQTLGERADAVVFIKDGFTWRGFLFGPLWLLSNALWFEFILGLLLVAGAAGALTQLGLKEEAAGVAYLLLMLIAGFEGNDLRRWRLERKGYRFLASAVGNSLEECEWRFFQTWLPSLTDAWAKPVQKPALDVTLMLSGAWSGPGRAGAVPDEIV